MGAPLPPPPSYLVPSILVALFCCQPLGIVGIVYAAQVNSKHAAGDYAGALEASRRAKRWISWGFGAGAALVLAALAFQVVVWSLIFLAPGDPFDPCAGKAYDSPECRREEVPEGERYGDR